MDDSDSETAKNNYIEQKERHGLLNLIARILINDASFCLFWDDG